MNENVEIFKLVFESPEGKEWFIEYLRQNLKLQSYGESDGFNISISFNDRIISTRRLLIHKNPSYTVI